MAQFLAHDARAFDHGAQFGKGDLLRNVEEPAIREDHNALRRNVFERLANALGHNVRSLDCLVFHGYDADALLKGNGEFAKPVQILAPAAGKFQAQLMDMGV